MRANKKCWETVTILIASLVILSVPVSAGRQYNPTLGRFMQPDPIVQNYYNPQNLNRYSYTLNNPMKYTDPTGHVVVYVGGLGSLGALLGGSGSGGLIASIDQSILLNSPNIHGLENTLGSFKAGYYKRGGWGYLSPQGSMAMEAGIAPFQQDIKEYGSPTFDYGFDAGEGYTGGLGIAVPREGKDFDYKNLNKFSVEGTVTLLPTDVNAPVPASVYGTQSNTQVNTVVDAPTIVNTASKAGAVVKNVFNTISRTFQEAVERSRARAEAIMAARKNRGRS